MSLNRRLAKPGRVEFPHTGAGDDLGSDRLSDRVGTVGQPQLANRFFVGGCHRGDSLRVEGSILQEAVDRHASLPCSSADIIAASARAAIHMFGVLQSE